MINFFSLKRLRILLAVGCGILENSTKSLLLKIGFSNIQSSARTEYYNGPQNLNHLLSDI
jgi:hypothetical protein